MKNDYRSRNHVAYWAFLVHRISGVALTLFLPLHFGVLGSALQGEARLESFLRWSDQPLVKAAETVLVLLLAAHLAGGVRLLLLEFMKLPGNANEITAWHQTLLASAAAVSVAVGLLFLLNLI